MISLLNKFVFLNILKWKITGDIPKDKKSVAINVTLQANNKTLTENDLDEISRIIIDTVNKKTGATIRS